MKNRRNSQIKEGPVSSRSQNSRGRETSSSSLNNKTKEANNSRNKGQVEPSSSSKTNRGKAEISRRTTSSQLSKRIRALVAKEAAKDLQLPTTTSFQSLILVRAARPPTTATFLNTRARRFTRRSSSWFSICKATSWSIRTKFASRLFTPCATFSTITRATPESPSTLRLN